MASTVVLMLLALGVSLAPIAIRYFDRQTVTRIAVVAGDDELASRSVGITGGVLNNPPTGVDPSTWRAPFDIVRMDAPEAQARLEGGGLGGVMYVSRQPTGKIDVRYVTNGPADGARAQMIGFAAIAIGILDWTSTLPRTASWRRSRHRASRPKRSTSRRPAVASRFQPGVASRSFLGIVFVVLIFITVVIYGMWVATGVAAEKSSRVMELMISAASPNQLLTGKVLGIGLAGLTQYAAIAIPALAVLSVQDRIAASMLGPGWAAEAPIVGLSPSLLLAYGVFFLLGFTLFALIYASMGAFVSRPDDLQTLSLP